MQSTATYKNYYADNTTVSASTPLSLNLETLLCRPCNHGYIKNTGSANITLTMQDSEGVATGGPIVIPPIDVEIGTFDMLDANASRILIQTASVANTSLLLYLK